MRTEHTAQKTEPESRYTVRAITENITVKDGNGAVIFEMKDAVVRTDVHHGYFKPAGYLLDGTKINKFELSLPAEGCTIEMAKGSMTLQARGNYKGTVRNVASYGIVTKSLASENLAVETADVFYKAGASFTPRVTVYDNGVKVAAKEYRIAFADGNAALAGYRLPEGAEYADVPFTITANAGGNYTGGTQMTGILHIYTKKINRAKVVLAKNGSDDNYYYTGQQVRPQVQSVTLRESANAQETTLLNRETDGYLVSYGENVKAGSAGVTIRGTGKYGGSKTVRFIIYPKWMKWIFG